MKAVLDTKPTSIYNDEISSHYQFPRRYLSNLEKCLNDWVILRRSRADGGNLAYFAIARLIGIDSDMTNPSMRYARFDNFLLFEQPVPWKPNGQYAEESLRLLPQAQVGIYLRGKSVRIINEDDFINIVSIGSSSFLQSAGVQPSLINETEPPQERSRRIQATLVNRIVRDSYFRDTVCNAYEYRSAITGLKISDSAGNYEVHAAHIYAVADGGPDLIQNGVALTATMHWLFDHYLISLDDNFNILVSNEVTLALLKNYPKRINLPNDPNNWPHRSFLKKHRERFLSIYPNHIK